jgi:hypothetical protein
LGDTFGFYALTGTCTDDGAKRVFFLINEGLENLRVDAMPYFVIQQSMTSGPANSRKGGSHDYQNKFEPPL